MLIYLHALTDALVFRVDTGMDTVGSVWSKPLEVSII
jgi:hypothetical protein